MWLTFLALFTALSISSVSAYFSVIGLTAIFAAAKIPIIIMGSIMELSKVVATIFVHRNWKDLTWKLKLYLSSAIVVLMLITSLGSFGFLSKAHLDQALPNDNNQIQLSIIDQKIQSDQSTITAAQTELAQLDSAVNQMMSRTTNSTGAQRAVNIRKAQETERAKIASTIDAANKEMLDLKQQEAPLLAVKNQLSAEVGPIKYIADMFYGGNADDKSLESAVRIVILMLVSVFDPLAIVMLIAATSVMGKKKQQLEQFAPHNEIPNVSQSAVPVWVKEFSGLEDKDFTKPEPEVDPITYNPIVAPEPEMSDEMRELYEREIAEMRATMEAKEEEYKSESLKLVDGYETMIADLNSKIEIKEIQNEGLISVVRQKDIDVESLTQTMNYTQSLLDDSKSQIISIRMAHDLHIKESETVLDDHKRSIDVLQETIKSKVSQLDEMNAKFEEYVSAVDSDKSDIVGENMTLKQKVIELSNEIIQRDADIAILVEKINSLMTPEKIAERELNKPDEPESDINMGSELPSEPKDHTELFVKNDVCPTIVYAWGANGWQEIDKAFNTSYITKEYIEFLIDTLASGKYGFADLTDAEQEAITKALS